MDPLLKHIHIAMHTTCNGSTFHYHILPKALTANWRPVFFRPSQLKHSISLKLPQDFIPKIKWQIQVQYVHAPYLCLLYQILIDYQQ